MVRISGDDGPLGTLRTLFLDHQLAISAALLLILFTTHIFLPDVRQTTRTFFELSYHDPVTDTYTQGWDDLPYVAFWVVVFVGIRILLMDYLLKPLALLGGIHKKKAIIRFQEQAFILIYPIIFWSLGMYIMYNSKYWLNLRELWTNFPNRSMSSTLKWYYLVQLAYWIQQIIVVNIEEKRKDYAQMFTHHIITSALVIMSYAYYQTKVGNVILCIMDIIDILLPAAKLLRYLGYQTACDIAFGVFMVTWFFSRHILFPMVCWSIYAHVPSTMPYGCYDSVSGAQVSTPLNSLSASSPDVPAEWTNAILPNIMQSFLDPGGVVCFNPRIRFAFLGLLLSLEAIMLLWFVTIANIAWKVIRGNSADDSRSDDEESDEEEDVETDSAEKVQKDRCASTGTSIPSIGIPLEEEVGVEDLHLDRRRGARVHVRRSAAAAANGRGAATRTTRDRKELLGRIGCDGPS
ncbi:hypothetical protein ASPZODRAFT_15257 [Penicilliopsis zonata CBS 506.65]|uniref:TLC domain-containing protein n=1 Tax=Penicilliopsis zonata CBS 506.65 TaxID=1073090 RepID=A0A1L9SKS3_9EURO|nr:hypothetical protein ASPZODRAFT_15257 [Penicilliopsis zonata CBS 506.65]OJJ47808.1 hypothetical protein ASPZODRAFT_15257 [Penicilliopsis zonata CBS 506.65]